MKKILKYVISGLAILFVLIIALISYFISSFNPNDFKPQIIQAIKDKQQRTLKLDGDIKLTFIPNLGAKVDHVSLSEYKSTKEFAAIDSARVSISLFPLLSRQVVVNEVGLGGVKVEIVKRKDGTTNLDDLIGKQEGKIETEPDTGTKPESKIKFDIAVVKIEKTELSYRDEGTGANYVIKDLNLKTGRIADDVPGNIDFEATVQANKPKLDIAAKIHTALTFNLENKYFQFEGLEVQVDGVAADITQLQLRASGNASLNLATQEYTAKKLVVTANGLKGKDSVKSKLNIPALSFTKNKIEAEQLTINADLDGEMGKVIAALTLQDMQGNAQAFKSSGLALDVDIKQAEQAFKLNLSTPIAGSVEASQLNLSNVILALSATGEKLPGKSISSEMKGSVQLDGERESVQLNLAGGLLQSQVKAKLAVKGFSEPTIRFDVELDQLDADLYLPKKSASSTAKSETLPEQPFDLSALRKLNLEGSLRMGSFKIANIKSSQLRVDVNARDGIVNVSPLSAKLYQGSINGNIVVDASHDKPIFTVKQNLAGVLIGPLIKDAADFDIAEGKGNVLVNISTQGNTVTALKKGLNGSLSLNMIDGAIKGIDLSKLVRGAQNLGQGGGMETLKPVTGDKTEFTELKAGFKINNGVAHNDDLLVKSQSLRVSGNGDIDIGNSSINYATRTTLAESVDIKNGSLTIPVQLIGPFADLKFKVDYAAVVSDVAKQKVNKKIEEKKDELKQQLQEKLKGGLQNLFK